MCDVCMRTPCHSRCPNAPEPPAVHICAGCEDEIRDGYDYYDVAGEPYCEDCVKLKTAESEE